MTTHTPIHISTNFFSKAARYFGSFQTAVSEVVQNAYRASLPLLESGQRPRLDITLGTSAGLESVEFRDYGMGIQDIGAALSIAVSSWDPSVEEEQDPAGMGLCAALAFSEAVKIRSDFGELTIDGKPFFNDSDYRDGLLDKILCIGGFDDGGTAITLVGPKFKPAAMLGSIRDVIKSELFYHGAIDATISSPDHDPQPVKTFRSAWDRGVPGSDITSYQGYEVWTKRGLTHGSRSESIGVLWHGQYISVPLDSPEYAGTIDIPGLGVVKTFPTFWRCRHVVIVIDHGLAPVTPKLPDRKSLIPDDKTRAFFWDFAKPLILEQAQNCMDWVTHELGDGIEAVEGGVLSSSHQHQYSQGRFGKTSVNDSIWSAIYAKLVNAYDVSYPVWDANGECASFVKGYRRQDNFPDILSRHALLRTSDGHFLAAGPNDDIDDSAASLTFAGQRSTTPPEGVVEIEGSWVPRDVVVSFGTRHMPNPTYNLGIMVFDVPQKFSDLVKDRKYGSGYTLANYVLTGEEGVQTTVYSFPNDEDEFRHGEIENLLDHDPSEVVEREQEWTDSINALLNEATSDRTVTIPGVIIHGGDCYDGEVSDLIFIGAPKPLADASYGTCECLCRCEYDEEPDHVRDHIKRGMAAHRQHLSGVAEVAEEVEMLLAKMDIQTGCDNVHLLRLDGATGNITVDYTADWGRGERVEVTKPYTS